MHSVPLRNHAVLGSHYKIQASVSSGICIAMILHINRQVKNTKSFLYYHILQILSNKIFAFLALFVVAVRQRDILQLLCQIMCPVICLINLEKEVRLHEPYALNVMKKGRNMKQVCPMQIRYVLRGSKI